MADTQTHPTSTEQLPAGTPIWVDLGSPDIKAAATFYSQLFGWEAQDLGPEAGGYTMFTLDGKQVAAVGPLMMEGQPTAWSTYISSDDADATARKVEEAGGRVLAPPMDVMDQGRLAVFMDPAGAAFSIWQPAKMRGAALFNQPGALSWNELQTTDVSAAKTFYERVFGWGFADSSMGQGEGAPQYTEWKLNDRSIGGAMVIQNPGIPPHWLAYFSVEDCDAAVARVTELGGRVMMPPMHFGPGRFSVVIDPQGAAFALFQDTSGSS